MYSIKYTVHFSCVQGKENRYCILYTVYNIQRKSIYKWKRHVIKRKPKDNAKETKNREKKENVQKFSMIIILNFR